MTIVDRAYFIRLESWRQIHLFLATILNIYAVRTESEFEPSLYLKIPRFDHPNNSKLFAYSKLSSLESVIKSCGYVLEVTYPKGMCSPCLSMESCKKKIVYLY